MKCFQSAGSHVLLSDAKHKVLSFLKGPEAANQNLTMKFLRVRNMICPRTKMPDASEKADGNRIQ